MHHTTTPRSPVFGTMRAWLLQVALVLPLVVVLPGCVQTGVNPVSGNTRAYGYSWEQEVEMGRKADKQIQQQYGVYEDEALQAYVDRVAQKVLAQSHMRRPDTPPRFRNTEFEFRILDSPIINAFALPGGYVYVTRGLLSHLNNEAQLAVVLGHEIGHVAARHSSKQAAQRQFMQGLLVAGAVAGQAAMGGQAAENVLGVGGQAAQLLSLSYSRGDETRSEERRVGKATLAGYDAAEGAAFFTSLERKQEQSGQGLPTWQSTHPDPGQREQNIPRLAQRWEQRTGASAATINRDVYLDQLRGTVLGKNPRQGFTENDIFYHPELAFQFPVPAGWRVINQPSQVAMVEPDQNAFLLFGFAQEDSPQGAANAFAAQQGVTVVDRSTLSIGGNAARRVLVEGQTEQGQTLRLLGYFFEYDGTVYRFQGVAAADNYSAYRPLFTQSATGFARLTDADKLNIQPTRVAVEPASRTAAFSSFVDETRLPSDMSLQDLAILNQVEENERIEAGHPLKLPTRSQQ